VRAKVEIEDVGKATPGDHRHRAAVPGEQGAPDRAHRELVREKLIEGIADGLRDESDKDGMRVVIELKRGEVTEIVLNNLYAQTPMETVFGINMVALQDGQPKLMSLEGNAGCLSSGIGAKSSPGAPFSICARRASARISWKASRSRWPTSTR
jgi:hypothetical protein